MASWYCESVNGAAKEKMIYSGGRIAHRDKTLVISGGTVAQVFAPSA